MPRENRRKKITIVQDPVTGTVKSLTPIRLVQVRKRPEEKIFNSLVHQFHYLGYAHPVGEHLKYIAYCGDTPLACLAFSSAPYQIRPRDTFLGWDKKAIDSNRHLLAYNTRFLILPWVKVPHLASHLLGLCARTISRDWIVLYSHPVYWLETFVDTERFAGTCYKAANWIFLGYTSGRGKENQTYKQTRSIKAMYGYPLVRNFREQLCHE